MLKGFRPSSKSLFFPKYFFLNFFSLTSLLSIFYPIFCDNSTYLLLLRYFFFPLISDVFFKSPSWVYIAGHKHSLLATIPSGALLTWNPCSWKTRPAAQMQRHFCSRWHWDNLFISACNFASTSKFLLF